MTTVYKIGQVIELFDQKLQVAVTPTGLQDCQQCEVHHLCSRRYEEISNRAKQFGTFGCTGLIGIHKHFKIWEQRK